MLNEFKAFISRGNVVDLAVGVIVGASFGTIVTSLVNDILMPPNASDRPAARGRGLQGFLREPLGAVVSNARRREDGGRPDAQLRRVPECADQLPHRVVRGLPAGPAGEPPVPEAGGRGPGHQGVRLVRDVDSRGSEALPALHLESGDGLSADGSIR